MTAITAKTIADTKAMLLSEGSPFELDEIVIERGRFKVFKNAPANLLELIDAGRAHGDAELFVFEDERWTFNQFFAKVDVLRTQLVDKFGVVPGETIAIAMRNYPEWLLAFSAAAYVGAIVVPLNSWGKTAELLHGIDDAGAKVLFCDEERYQLIAEEVGKISAKVVVARSERTFDKGVHRLDQLLADKLPKYAAIPSVDGDATAVVFYTSGSSGYPKGVMLTHRTLGQYVMNMMFGGMFGMVLANRAMGALPPMVTLTTVPLFHATGLGGTFLLPMRLGQKVVLMYKWDAERALQLIERERVTNMLGTPATVRSLLMHPAFDQYDVSTINRMSMGGAATPIDLPILLKEKLGDVSCANGWGMTENCAVGSIISEDIYHLRPDSSGFKSPIIELRMVDESGATLPPGEIGEIECYGVTTTPGYWRRPDATAEIYHDGWLRTGDLGCIDEDGFVCITGRIKEVVIRGGENIYPIEIENAAYKQPAVEEVVVFGVPDAQLGEELALVFYAGASNLSVDLLREHLKCCLAGYKVPKYIYASAEPLPQNVSNKLFKRVIRDHFIANVLA